MREEIEASIGSGRLEDALAAIETILARAPQEEQWSEAAWAARKKAQCHFMRSRLPDAVAAAEEALEFARKTGEPSEEADAENVLGVIHGELGRLERAVQHLERSYQLHRQAANPRMATVLNNIGNTCLILDDAERALGYFQRALDSARDPGEGFQPMRQTQATSLANIGRALSALERPEEAVAPLQESLGIFRELGNETLRVHALMKLAQVLEKTGDEDEAEALYREALSSAAERSDETWLFELHGNLGRLLYRLNRLEEAQPHLYQAMTGLPDLEQSSDLPEWRKEYSEILWTRGEMQEAWHEVNTAFHELEELAQRRTEKQIYQAMGRLELERMEHENEIYRLRNEELADALQQVQDLQQQLEERNAELAELAVRDPLTAAFNRRRFVSRLSMEIDRSRRYRSPLSIAILDLDHFKSVNDTYGHTAGDRVLQGLVEILTQNTRSSDEVARHGGEEFAVIMPETELDEARTVLEKLRQMVESQLWQQTDLDRPITFSAGIAELDSDDSAETLVNRADQRLYQAKDAGRNRVVAAEG